jgi:hypothetical protein
MIIEVYDIIKDIKVFCTVIDLNEFIHAGEDENVFVEDEYGNQYLTAKQNLRFDVIIGL